MARTIATTTLTTSVTEEISLNGTNFNTTTTQVIPNIGNYVNNVFNVDTGTQAILSFSRSGVGPRNGEYDIDNIKYLRLTNADDTTDIKIIMGYVVSADQFVMVKAGGSFVLTDFTQATGDTIETISITTAANVDIPYAIGLIS
jgi:hypothetical protein|tara:strand:+ start:7958 stop:8389 length:432 start_codon:yes stop_codon:yes gene_type:complete